MHLGSHPFKTELASFIIRNLAVWAHCERNTTVVVTVIDRWPKTDHRRAPFIAVYRVPPKK